MDVLRSALVLLGILAVTGCHHGYHHGGPGWYDPGYGACVPPEDGYYDGWAMPPMPWDTDPRMARRAVGNGIMTGTVRGTPTVATSIPHTARKCFPAAAVACVTPAVSPAAPVWSSLTA